MANRNDAIGAGRRLVGRKLLSAAAAAALCAGAGAALAATPKNALVMAWNVDAISTFDPAQVGEVVTNEILQNTCDTLADFDPADERKVIPSFAERWDVSPDRKEITFHLRKGAKFPSGNPVTAEDVAWSLHRVVKLNFGNAATLTEYGFTKDNVEKSIVAGPNDTLVLKFDKPYPTTLMLQAIAANRVSMIMDKKTLMANEQGGDLGNKYLATRTACVGPYKLTRWNAGESIVLEANDGYWGKAPGLKRILIRHVAEPGTQRLLLSQGDVDVARDLTPEDLKDLEGSKDVSIVKVLRPQLFYWGFNVADGPFSKEKVRLAMRYLIDYEGLGKTVMTYLGVPRASFAQLGAVGALDEKEGQPFKLDLDKAKQLLTEAGYPNGFEASVLFGTLPHANPIAQSVQQNAAKVGVKLSLERMANAQLFSKVRGREYQSAMLAWQTGVPDAHGNASRLVFNPDNRPEAKQTQYPSWRSAYQDLALNKQIDEALLEPDPAKRDALYATIQKEVMAKGPMAFMFQMNSVAGVRKDLKSWTWNGFRTYYELATK